MCLVVKEMLEEQRRHVNILGDIAGSSRDYHTFRNSEKLDKLAQQ